MLVGEPRQEVVEASAVEIPRPGGTSEPAAELFRGRDYGLGGRHLPPRTDTTDATQISGSVWHHERKDSYSRVIKQELQSQRPEGPAGQHSYRCQARGQVGTMTNKRDEPLPAPSSKVTFLKKVFVDPGWIRPVTLLGALLAPSPSPSKCLLLL